MSTENPKSEYRNSKQTLNSKPEFPNAFGAFQYIKDFLVFIPILFAAVYFFAVPQAWAGFVPLPDNLCGPFPCPEGNTGVEIAQSLVEKIVRNVRVVIGAVAIVMIVVSGIKLLTSGGNEEVFSKQSMMLIYSVIGLLFVGLAGELARIFDVDRGGFLKDPSVALQRARLFSRTLEVVITFLKYIIGSIAVLFIVRNGLRLIISSGSEEEVGKDKKNIMWGLLGLVIILISNPIINKVFFKIDTSTYPGLNPVQPGIDPNRLVKEIAGITNLVASIVGPFALLSLLAGGLMYALAAGDDEKIGKAKKMIMWSVIGIVIIYGAFAIVSTFVAGRFEGL